MREKKKLIEALHKVVEDIMDNYDKYSENEINEIKKFYNNAIALNDKLEHYDQKKSVIDKLKEAFENFFGGKNKWVVKITISIVFGTLFGLLNIDFGSLHLVVLGIIWILNVFVSYTLSYFIGLLFKIKFNFLNIIALAFSYTFSVILVILFSGSLDYLYITSYFSIVTIIGIIYGLYKLYQSKKNFYK